jgi:hypothetical protein
MCKLSKYKKKSDLDEGKLECGRKLSLFSPFVATGSQIG